MNKESSPLSASKVKTLQSCSWLYWAKYHLKLPEDSNDGANRGTICHLVFECLGNPRHKKHYNKILKGNSTWKSKAIKRLILIHAKKLKVYDLENLNLINEMILNGIKYDFFGTEQGKPTKAVSEESFNITVNEGEKKYHIRGFIDKLFLYKKKSKALIRDFKTSKKVFSGKEKTDNLQDLMYSLAVKKIYPEFMSRQSEFLFLKFDLGKDMLGNKGEGVIEMAEISDEELDGFEIFLTEIQSIVDEFTLSDAGSNLAARQDYPKDGSFGGPLSCGFAKYPGQLKKDGTKMWHCPHKFSYKYWRIKSKEGKTISCHFTEDAAKKIAQEEDSITEELYKGCPHWNRDEI